MKKTLLVALMSLVLAAPAALAGGVNLTWGTVCRTEQPQDCLVFACDANAAVPPHHWTLSFMIDSEMADMVGIEVTLVAQSLAAPALPDWWRLEDGGCREGMLGFTFDFRAVADETCDDWTRGQAMGGVVWNSGQDQYRPGDDPYWGPIYSDPSTARLIAVAAIGADAPFVMQPGVEYYAVTFGLQDGGTVGAGSCAGCGLPMAIDARLVCVAGLDGRRDYLMDALPGGHEIITWQSAATPARNGTWSLVKSLYR